MQTGQNVDSAPALWAYVRFLEKTTPFTLDNIWAYQTAQTSISFTTRYGMSSSRVFFSRECIMLKTEAALAECLALHGPLCHLKCNHPHPSACV